MSAEHRQMSDLAAEIAKASEDQGQVLIARTSWEIAERLTAAGYRKFEIVDETEPKPYPRERYEEKWPKTGGPFQGGGAYWNDPVQHGLTIRDYFAAEALQGMFANESVLTRFGKAAQAENVSPDVLAATAAYSVADAMLKERAK